jgi:hypothetical protein
MGFRPIVEFFPIDRQPKNVRQFIDVGRQDRKDLRDLLKNHIGIYAFYNSEMEVIYVGKSETQLFSEMVQTFNRKIERYFRYWMNHEYGRDAQGKFKIVSGVRQIKRHEMFLYDAAAYFSAYAVDEDDVGWVEQLLIRMIPNDLLNLKMEGNGSLEMVQE